MNSKAQSPNKAKSNAKDKSDKEQSRKSVSLDRISKGEIQLQNKFESLTTRVTWSSLTAMITLVPVVVHGLQFFLHSFQSFSYFSPI